MCEIKIQLKPSSLLNIPLQIYDNDFTFIVNGREYKTSRLISDLLSPKISRIHSTDPTFDKFTINTYHSGNFSNVLNLINFKLNEIPESELLFISEIIEQLGDAFFYVFDENENDEITIDNVFCLLQKHQKYIQFYSKSYDKDIEFISSHFFELCETKEEELLKLDTDTLISILRHQKLRLKEEDQLLHFINKLYLIDSKYSTFYEEVYFLNVSSNSMDEFLEIYDSEDMTKGTWFLLCDRLKSEIKTKRRKSEEEKNNKKLINRYTEIQEKKKGKLFLTQGFNEFTGILNYLRTQSNDQIENEINITASSYYNNYECYHPRNVVLFEDRNKVFESKNLPGSWICFDFKERRLIPTDYSIRSGPWTPNSGHPKNWVIEVSNDNNDWLIIDEQIESSFLNGPRLVHTFKIEKTDLKKIRYFRLRQTGENLAGGNVLEFESIEIYGRLI